MPYCVHVVEEMGHFLQLYIGQMSHFNDTGNTFLVPLLATNETCVCDVTLNYPVHALQKTLDSGKITMRRTLKHGAELSSEAGARINPLRD